MAQFLRFSEAPLALSRLKIGIDSPKAAQEVFIGFAETAFTPAIGQVAIRDLIRQLVAAEFVIFEATGSIEAPVP